MENFADLELRAGEKPVAALLREVAHTDEPFRLEDFHNPSQMLVTGGIEFHRLACGQFVRREIATGLFEKCQRAVVSDKMIGEEFFRPSKPRGEQSPQTLPADFRTLAGETLNGTFGVFPGWLVNPGVDAEPITNRGNLAKGHAGLNHAEGTGVHAEKHHALAGAGVPGEVELMRGPGVAERVVNAGDRRAKLQPPDGVGQLLRGGNGLLGDGVHR